MASVKQPQQAKPYVRDHTLQAVFLTKFASHVTWPKQGLFPSKKINLCVAGENPFDDRCMEMFANNNITLTDGAALEKQYFHMIYIPPGYPVLAQEILSTVGRKPTLVISAEKNFHKIGGDIAFVEKHKKIKLILNTAQARAKGITFSDELKAVALMIVNQEITTKVHTESV